MIAFVVVVVVGIIGTVIYNRLTVSKSVQEPTPETSLTADAEATPCPKCPEPECPTCPVCPECQNTEPCDIQVRTVLATPVPGYGWIDLARKNCRYLTNSDLWSLAKGIAEENGKKITDIVREGTEYRVTCATP